MDPTPISLLRLGLKEKAPLAALALGIVTLLSGYAVIASYFSTPRAAIVAAIFMCVAAALVIVLSALASPSRKRALAYPALFLAWAISLLFVSLLVLTGSCFFFGWPDSFERLWGSGDASIERMPDTRVAEQPASSVTAAPKFETFEQDVEYGAGDSGSCTERNVTKNFTYCAVEESSPLQARILRYSGPVERWGRNSSSSIEINAPRAGCAVITLKYSDYGRGTFGDCKGNGNIRVIYKLFIERQVP